MDVTHGILIAVDDSEAAERTLQYVANVTAGRPEFRIRLLHLLPLIPPELLEHGGSEYQNTERTLNHKIRKERQGWIEERQAEARPLFEHAKSILGTDAVDVECRPSIDQVAVARDCIEAARDSGCRTIVIGRQTLPWYRELFHKHACDELVKHASGLTVWVVE